MSTECTRVRGGEQLAESVEHQETSTLMYMAVSLGLYIRATRQERGHTVGQPCCQPAVLHSGGVERTSVR